MNRRSFLVALGVTTLAAGCGAPAASPTAAPPQPTSPPPAKPAPATTPAPAPKSAPATTPATPAAATPAVRPKPADVIKVRIVQSTPGLTFTPFYLADVKGFWAEEGLEVERTIAQSGANSTATLISGEAQFMASSSSDPIVSWEKGLPVLAVVGVSNAVTMNIGARKEWAQSKGLTAQSPIKDRVMAMKGTKIGVSSVSGAPTQFGKYLLKSQGLDPEKDVDFVVVGAGAPRIAALRQAQVDFIIGGVPDAEVAEHEGVGIVYISLSKDSPVFGNFTFQVLTVTKEYAEKNAEAIRRAARVTARANTIIQTDLPAATAALKQAMPEINPNVMELGMRSVQSAFLKDAMMNEAAWTNAVEVLLASGGITRRPPLAEGELWTNKFVK